MGGYLAPFAHHHEVFSFYALLDGSAYDYMERMLDLCAVISSGDAYGDHPLGCNEFSFTAGLSGARLVQVNSRKRYEIILV